MESEEGPIRLRKVERKPDDRKKARSHSLPRRGNTIADRTRQIELEKSKRIRQTQLEQEEERERQEEAILKARRQRPVIYQRRKPEEPKIWDENGYLLDQESALRRGRGKPESEVKTSHIDPRSLAIVRRMGARGCESEVPPEFTERPRPLRRSVSREAFKSFVERQEIANKKKVAAMEPKRRRHSSVMNAKSVELLESPRRQNQAKKKPYEPEEYSFMPDMSLTSKVRSSTATGLTCRDSVARAKVKRCELEDARMRREDAEMKQCTFYPDMHKTSAQREEAQKRATEILMKKQERAKKIEKMIREAEDEAIEQKHYVNRIPAKTRKLHDILGLFKDPDEVKKRESLAPKKRRSASAPRFSK